MHVPRRFALALLVLALLAPLAPAATSAVPDCPVLAQVPGVGPACRAPDGLLAVHAPSGELLGYTHGVDALDGAAVASASPKPPACVAGLAGDAYVRVIYARAVDDADQYAALAPAIRDLVATANGMVSDAAVATGGAADLKVLCAGGVIVVANETLPTPKASASFSTIVTDLRAKGYTSTSIKNWVFYDDTGACGCTGTGHLYRDDSLAATNLNNGGPGSSAMFAVDFGYTGATGARTLLHELGHTLGAVQWSAPHTSGAGHCWDGKDTMCYNDGGPNATRCTVDFYCSSVCSVEAFDCGHDDYFHRNPPAGSYLATHWNIGNALDRFLAFGVPVVTLLACPSVVGPNQTATCTMQAADDGTQVRYDVAWGDGATTCVPSCSGFVAPGANVTASHAYATGGARNVTVTATDNGSAPQTSSPARAALVVDATPPVSTLVLAGTKDAASGWYRTVVVVNVTATDEGGAGVDASFVSLDGDAFAAPARTMSADGAHAVLYKSRDRVGNEEVPRDATVRIDRTKPSALLVVACDPCVGAVALAWSGADAGSHLRSARIAWTLDAPVALASGVACAPNVADLDAASGSCSFTGWMGDVPGPYCFTLTTTDQAGNAATSAQTCARLV